MQSQFKAALICGKQLEEMVKIKHGRDGGPSHSNNLPF
jgi:hypothetical protein